MNDLGVLKITQQWVDLSSGGHYPVITGVEWVGPPLVIIGGNLRYFLPDWAVAQEGDVIQLGEYVLRSTGVAHPPSRGVYYYRIDDGLPYWLWWRLMQVLEWLTVRVVLTLAVWGMAAWPREQTIPSWRDVIRRWRKS